jgi:hypothetical protein
MRVTGTILAALAVVMVTATPSGSGNKASEAEVHLRKACELVWTNADVYQIERCTKRAMSAMGDTNRLRDNELKRLLMSSERELETCTQELNQAVDDRAPDIADARHHPEPR